MIRQNPEDIDPDQWLDEGELMEQPEIPREKAEVRLGNEAENLRNIRADVGPVLEIPIVPEDLEVVAAGDRIPKRIQVEFQHEDKEVEGWQKRWAPPAWNESFI